MDGQTQRQNAINCIRLTWRAQLPVCSRHYIWSSGIAKIFFAVILLIRVSLSLKKERNDAVFGPPPVAFSKTGQWAVLSLTLFLSLACNFLSLPFWWGWKKVYLFFSLTTWRGLDTDWKEGGRSRSEREHGARVDGEMAYLEKEKCGVKAVLFSLHSLDCSVVRKAAFYFLHCALLLFLYLLLFIINFLRNIF